LIEQPEEVASADREGVADETVASVAPGGASGRRGPVRVALLALVIVAVITAGTLALGRRGEPDGGGAAGDATAVLDSALADGMPAYVLIHSLT
jgi:hypothetical protein